MPSYGTSIHVLIAVCNSLLLIKRASVPDLSSVSYYENATAGANEARRGVVSPAQDRSHLLFSETALHHRLLSRPRERFSQLTIGLDKLGRSGQTRLL